MRKSAVPYAATPRHHYVDSVSTSLPYHAFLVNNDVDKKNSDSINQDEENYSTNSFTEDDSK